jgi:uncharacterized protein
MQKTEIRTIATALRIAPNSADFKLEGTACSYNALSKDLGGFVECIAPGAFSRSLANKNQDVVCTFNHNNDIILGRLQNRTLTLKDSPYSLDFSCQLDPNQTTHRDLYSSVKRGDISECSFAFAVDNGAGAGEKFDSIQTGSGTTTLRTILAAHLFDVSAVTNPAYGNGATNVNARQLRSADYSTTRLAADFKRARAICAQYPELSYEHVAQCLRLGYDEDQMLLVRGAAIGKLIREGRAC